MKKALVLLCLLTLAAVLPASAQTEPHNIARVYEIVAKPGMGQQWRDGVKKFNQWLRDHHDQVTSYTWEAISGDRWGHYFIGTFGHSWKDFDDMEKNAPEGVGQQIQQDISPYIESVKCSYFALRTDLTVGKPDPTKPPARFTELITFMLKPGSDEDVADAIKAGNHAAEKSHWSGSPSRWYSLANGGEGSQLVLAIDHKNWADFQQPDPNFGKMMRDFYGDEPSEAIWHGFNKGLRSVTSELLRYEPDLSYIPDSK